MSTLKFKIIVILILYVFCSRTLAENEHKWRGEVVDGKFVFEDDAERRAWEDTYVSNVNDYYERKSEKRRRENGMTDKTTGGTDGTESQDITNKPVSQEAKPKTESISKSSVVSTRETLQEFLKAAKPSDLKFKILDLHTEMIALESDLTKKLMKAESDKEALKMKAESDKEALKMKADSEKTRLQMKADSEKADLRMEVKNLKTKLQKKEKDLAASCIALGNCLKSVIMRSFWDEWASSNYPLYINRKIPIDQPSQLWNDALNNIMNEEVRNLLVYMSLLGVTESAFTSEMLAIDRKEFNAEIHLKDFNKDQINQVEKNINMIVDNNKRKIYLMAYKLFRNESMTDMRQHMREKGISMQVDEYFDKIILPRKPFMRNHNWLLMRKVEQTYKNDEQLMRDFTNTSCDSTVWSAPDHNVYLYFKDVYSAYRCYEYIERENVYENYIIPDGQTMANIQLVTKPNFERFTHIRVKSEEEIKPDTIKKIFGISNEVEVQPLEKKVIFCNFKNFQDTIKTYGDWMRTIIRTKDDAKEMKGKEIIITLASHLKTSKNEEQNQNRDNGKGT